MMISLMWSLNENEGLNHLGKMILKEVNYSNVKEISSDSIYWLIVIFKLIFHFLTK